MFLKIGLAILGFSHFNKNFLNQLMNFQRKIIIKWVIQLDGTSM